MAKQALKRGDVLLFSVSRSQAVALKVAALDDDDTCVVATSWEGAAKSAWAALKSDARLKTVQAVTHHDKRRPMLGAWLPDAPPQAVKKVGSVRLAALQIVHPRDYVNAPEGKAEQVLPRLSWRTFLDEVRLQWRWDVEREALLEEESLAQASRMSAFQAAVRGAGR
jgi:hypothetical protein